MIEWARRRIFDGCRNLAEKIKTDKDERRIRDELLERNRKDFIKAPDVLNGESPWKLYSNQLGGVSVYVYCYDTGQWENITSCSHRILGVKNGEITNVMQEKFKGIRLKNDYSNEYCFENADDAQVFVKDVAPWYDEYHLPRAMMDRMLCYAEGGYPPYFKDHKKCPNEEQMEEHQERKSAEAARDRQLRAMMGR